MITRYFSFTFPPSDSNSFTSLTQCLFFPCDASPRFWVMSPLTGLHGHTQTHHSLYDSSVPAISPVTKTSNCTTHNTHNRQTSLPPSGGIRTRNPRKRAAADRRLRRRRRTVPLYAMQYCCGPQCCRSTPPSRHAVEISQPSLM